MCGMDNTKVSPLPVINGQAEILRSEMSFYQALELVSEGKKITKLEWDDKRTYGFIKDGLLCIHKAGEAEGIDRPWILNDGDLAGDDWIVL